MDFHFASAWEIVADLRAAFEELAKCAGAAPAQTESA